MSGGPLRQAQDRLDIRSLSVTEAAKLLKVAPKTIRAHIRRGLPLVDGRIDLIVYGAWLNQQEEHKKAADSGASPQDGA
jgi:hypothetical protein